MNPLTRAASTTAGAAVIASTALMGTRFVAIGVVGLVVVAAVGWPRLLRVYRRRIGSAIIAASGLISVAAIAVGRGEPYLRYGVAAAAAAVMLALSAEIFFPSPKGRALTSVTGMMTGAMVAVSSGAWVAAMRTPGARDLVVAGAAALALAGIASVATPRKSINLVAAAVLAIGGGAWLGLIFPTLGWAGGALTGLIAASVVILIEELASREANPRSLIAAVASGLTSVLASGVLVYLGGRLLVG